jgi:hypothetical protein
MMGEHIRALKGGQWLHAIDCGDETVLHLAEDAAPRRVRRAYRPEFVAGAQSVEIVTHRERTFPPKEVVRRAYSRAADPALAAMFPDSEAFAGWCTTGRLTAPRNVVGVPGVQGREAAGAPRPGAPRRERAVSRTKPAGRPAKRAKSGAPARKPKRAAKKVVRAAKRSAPRSRTAKPVRPAKRKGRR